MPAGVQPLHAGMKLSAQHSSALQDEGCMAPQSAYVGFQPGQGMTCPHSVLKQLYGDTSTCLSLPPCIAILLGGFPVSMLHAKHWQCILSWSDRALLLCRSMRTTCLGRWPRTLRSWGPGCTPAAVPHMMRPLPSAGPCLICRFRCSISTAAAQCSAALVSAVEMLNAYPDKARCLSRHVLTLSVSDASRAPNVVRSLVSGAPRRRRPCCLSRPTLASCSTRQHKQTSHDS